MPVRQVPALPRGCAIAFAAAVLLSSAGSARPQSTPDPGVHPISGRRIAAVMSHTAADWLDRPERVQEEQPDRALGVLGVRPGQVVADVGAGSGYYTVRLARRVAPGGTVYATDIQPQMLALLETRLAREKVGGVVPVLATLDDPGLPEGRLDLILMVDVYHELSRPQQTLRQLKLALKPTGRLALIEFRKEDARVPIRDEHKMSIAEAKLELEAEGYRLVKASDVLPWQHILVFDIRLH
jgi:ubiquinone/menaquinone biosynthesis C-methylase UbiE